MEMIAGLCEIECCIASKKSLSRCGRCKVALYCGREHQQLDFAKHKEICEVVCKFVRQAPPAPRELFPTGVSNFIQLGPIYIYLQFKRNFIKTLHLMNTPNSLLKASQELEEYLSPYHFVMVNFERL